MKSIYLPIFLLVTLIITSCQRELDENQIIYQGQWESSEYTLIIYSNGKGSCIQKKLSLRCNGYVTISNHKMVFTSSSLDAHIFRVKFAIDQKPEKDARGVAYMILDGERFEQ